MDAIDILVLAVAQDRRFAGPDPLGWMEVHDELTEDFGPELAHLITVEAAAVLLIASVI